MERLFGDEPGASRDSAPARPGAPAALDPGAPLAARMRPATLEGVVGQTHLLRPGSPLRTAIEQGQPHSMILHGPPGTGKTTLARIVAAASDSAFEEESAVAAGRAEVRAVIDRARARRKQSPPRSTVFFLDEIHRFNKAQQDALLPAVEDGLITLIGATTENPYFEVNSALLSRTRIYELRALEPRDIRALLERAQQNADDAALDFLANRSGGDARTALNALQLAAETAGPQNTATLAHAEDALQRKALLYDRKADNHYDTISAWIKATRGSDPDASLYYLAVMLEGGEDPRFIVRRMIVLASEDVGNADPQALSVATAAAAAVEHVGLPEAQFALAQAAIYLSLAPKSDRAKRSIGAARGWIREHGAELPPTYLRTQTRRRGDYDSPHDHPDHISPQPLLPENARDARFYEPDDSEATLRDRLERVQEVKRARQITQNSETSSSQTSAP